MTRRLVIVGADAAGMSAAAEARRLDPTLEIVAFERGAYASYSQCGLPYLVGGLVADPERLVARSVEQFAQQGIEVRLGHEVTAIAPARGTVHVRHDGGEMETGYDALVLATGASPAWLDTISPTLAGVFHLDVMEDALAIRQFLQERRPRRVTIVGGGYIGLEAAENLRDLGLDVVIVQRPEQVFTSVDIDIVPHIAEELEAHGVDVSLRDSVVEACVGSEEHIAGLVTNQGMVETDMVLLATGVHPNTTLAAAAGVTLGATGAIAVDDRQRTNLPNIYAAGDCAEHWHRLLQRPSWVPLGTHANKQGRVAGHTIGGGDATFGGIVGTAITRVFQLQVGRTGLSEREARAAGITPMAKIIESTNHAGYMPDALPITLKLVAEDGTDRVLGLQAVGRGGVAHRVDVVATALYAGLTLTDLTRLDLEYAPPFNSVWDPIQVAATSLLRRRRAAGNA